MAVTFNVPHITRRFTVIGRNLLLFLVRVRTKEEGILVVNLGPIIYLHVDICLVNSGHAVFNSSSVHVFADQMPWGRNAYLCLEAAVRL